MLQADLIDFSGVAHVSCRNLVHGYFVVLSLSHGSPWAALSVIISLIHEGLALFEPALLSLLGLDEHLKVVLTSNH